MVKIKKVVTLVLLLIAGMALLHAQTPDLSGAGTSSGIQHTPIVRGSIVPDLEMSFTLTINGKSVGSVDAGIWNNAAILQREVAANLLIDLLRPDIYSTIFDSVFKGLTWLTADDFSTVGIGFLFDSAALTLAITIPPSYAPIVDIDFVPEQVPNYKPILRPAPFSGFVQTDSNLQVSDTAGGTATLYSHLFSMIDIRGLHLAANGFGTYSSGLLQPLSFSLENAYGLWNSNARSLQATFGMFTPVGTGLQTQVPLLAASISSSDNYQYIVRQGFIDDKTEFTITTTARVTIQVNGRTIRQVVLAPGNYRILDLPFTSGLNEYVLRIEESNGSVQVLRRTIPRETSVLVVGTSKYALSAGVSPTDLSEFLATGYYLYGFSPTFSGGINLQSDRRSAMGGLTWVAALPFGNINGSAALVGRWDGWGSVLTPEASLGYTLTMSWNDYLPTISLSATYRGTGFVAPSVEAPSGTPPGSLIMASGGIFSRIFSRTGLSLSYSFTQIQNTPATTTHDIFGSISQGLSNRGNLSLSGRLSLRSGVAPAFSATLAFTIQPSDANQRMLSYSQTSDSRTNISILDKLAAFGRLYELNLNASNFLPGADSDSSINLGLRTLSDAYEIAANGSLAYSKNSGAVSGVGSLQFKTTLVFVGPHIGFTKQTPDSFLLIAASKALKNLEAVYSLSSGAQYLARSGQNVVIPLTSYRTAVLATNLPGAELNFNPRSPYTVVSPGFRSGVLFVSDIVRRSMILGRLVDQNHAPISYLPADVYDLGGALITSTFTDDTGVFNIYDLLPGSYRIAWPEGYGSTSFELKESDSDSLDLGEIVLRSSSK